MHKQLTKYREEHNLLIKFQFGFRNGSGTQEVLVNVDEPSMIYLKP